MKIKKSIQLTTQSFEVLLKDGESLDFRLDQDTWKDLKIDDYIEYWEDLTGWQKEPTSDARKVIVQIKNIYRAPTFVKLFEVIDKKLEEPKDLLNSFREWWSEKKEKENGTLAFFVKRI